MNREARFLERQLPQDPPVSALDWLAREQPDAVCLQETKLEDANFPRVELEPPVTGRLYCGQRTYNGVALLTRSRASDIVSCIPDFLDEQKRVLAATVDGVRIVCIYVPNGQTVVSDKYRYKLAWLDALQRWLAQEMKRHSRLRCWATTTSLPRIKMCTIRSLWEGKVLFSKPERAAFRALLELGLKDSFRLFEQPPRSPSAGGTTE